MRRQPVDTVHSAHIDDSLKLKGRERYTIAEIIIIAIVSSYREVVALEQMDSTESREKGEAVGGGLSPLP